MANAPVETRTIAPTESLKRAVSSPAFIAAFVVLAVAALSLNAATQYLKLYFKKEAVPLAIPLEKIPTHLGPWIQVSIDQPLNHEMLDVLGTKQYIFRDYIDSRRVSPEAVAAFNDKTDKERGMLLAKIQHETPEAVMRAGVTYYTGMVDTVAHIPDRCYVADGFVPDKYDTPTWNARSKTEQPLPIPVRFINFEDTTVGRNAEPRNVAYFFNCNGHYGPDPIMDVRVRMQDLTERHAYYAKVELMNVLRDRVKSAAAMEDFLSFAMPEVEKCLPDWAALKARASAAKSTPAAAALVK